MKLRNLLLCGLASLCGADSGTPPQKAVSEDKMVSALYALALAQADFRANDRDGNRVQDFWTGDVAGLYYMTPATAKGNNDPPIRLIAQDLAAADAAPLKGDKLPGEYGKPDPCARSGYLPYRLCVMTRDGSVAPPVVLQRDTGGIGGSGAVHHPARFAICAYPTRAHAAMRRTLIINECNTVFAKKTGGKAILTWPSDLELLSGWEKMEFRESK